MSRIQAIDVFPVTVPVKATFNFASGSAGRAGDTAKLICVRVQDDDGAVGWGECRPLHQWSYETTEAAVATLRRYLAPALIGHPVADRAGLQAKMNSVIGRGPSTGQPIAKSAVDMAAHDLIAKRAGLPLREFLGGARDRRDFPISFTITGHTEVEVQAEIGRAQAEGFKNFNFKAAVQGDTDLAIARLLKTAMRGDGFLWSDANQGLNIVEAKHIAREFLAIGVDVLEQPLPADQIMRMAELRRSTTIPLAIDEASVSPSDFMNYVLANLVDFLVIKVTRSGGLWPSFMQCAVARSAGLPILVSGLTDGMLTKLAACQLASVFGVTRPVALNGSQFIDDGGLYPAKADVECAGQVHLNDRPGIGIEPDIDYLRRYAAEL
jgi:muconate cycloisomerase